MARKKNIDSGRALYGDFQTNLKSLIYERNIKQADLAEELKTTRQNINNYCNGKTTPDYKTILKIAEYFDVSVDWLIGRKGAVRSTNIEIQKVCKFTGLSERAVKELHSYAEDTKVSENAMIDWKNQTAQIDFYDDEQIRNDPPVIINNEYTCTFWDYLKDVQDEETRIELLNRFICSKEFETIARCMLDIGQNTLFVDGREIEDHYQKAARYDMLQELMSFCDGFAKEPIETPRTKSLLSKYQSEKTSSVHQEV